MRPATAAASAIAAIALGCSTHPSGRGGPAASASAAPLPEFSVRRPPRHYYVGRTRERCEVYWVDEGDVTSPPIVTPCPPDLEIGERIRLAGMTCARESTRDEARARPVVCPDALTNAEREERRRANAP